MKRQATALVSALALAGLSLTSTLSDACTSFVLRDKDNSYVYARTTEFGGDLKEKLILFPRNYQYKGVGPDGVPGTGLNWTGKYAAVGINALGVEFLLDGMNEKGMSGGLLNLPNSSVYQKPTGEDAKKSIASWQMLEWVLSNFENTDQVKAELPKIFVNSSALAAYKGIVKVHMTLHDMNGKSIVVEYLDGKLVITDNPIGTVANDPPMSWQLTNVGNYRGRQVFCV